MIRAALVLGVARAEARQLRRLVRFWLFAGIAGLFVLAAFLYYAVLHGFLSSYSGTLGAVNPRYLLAGLGYWYLMVFVVGLVFMSFDVRARDRRDRVDEVLDSRPYSNLELLLGRWLGQVGIGWSGALGIMLLVQLIGWLLDVLGAPFGGVAHPASLVNFIFLMALPSLAFVVGLTFFVAMRVRQRFLVALIVLAALAGLVWLGWSTPFHSAAGADLFGGLSVAFVSDLLPKVTTSAGVPQRLAVLLGGLGLVFLAAAVHPRRDGQPRRNRALLGGGLVALMVLVCLVVAYRGAAEMRRYRDWAAAHEARAEEPAVDVERVTGEVLIRPGRELALDLTLDLRARAEDSFDRLLFTLNPGLAVSEVTDDAGRELVSRHRDGLLEVDLVSPLAAGSATSLRFVAGGRPNTDFGYLDGARHPLAVTALENQLLLLGTEPGVFARRYVALMPGIRWLPTPGAEARRDDPRIRVPDFFTVDLEVEVPAGWLVAGPGRRRAVAASGDDRSRFRFAPGAPLPEVALVASRFESRSVEVDGILFEYLGHPTHTENLEFFADAAGEIESWIGQKLGEAKELGLPYPYDGFTLVEAPFDLRTYGGGWRQDTTFAPPAMLLVREAGFPTSRFAFRFRDPKRFEDREGGVPREKRRVLAAFFQNDFSGGNLFLGASRNFFAYLTGARGESGLALGFVNQSLADHLITKRDGYFSIHLYSRELGTVVGSMVVGLSQKREEESVADVMIETVVSRPGVWDKALSTPLAGIDPQQDPSGTVDLLVLKGRAMARWLEDGLGRERAARVVSELRRRYRGEAFDLAAFQAVCEEQEVDVDALLGDWLTSTAMPGFVVDGVQRFRLADAEDGTPRYQTLFTIRNDEPVPGLLAYEYRVGQEGELDPWERSEPVPVGGRERVEIGLVTSQPVQRLQVEPYLSLNRQAFELSLPPLDEEASVDRAPIVGHRVAETPPEVVATGEPDAIVVDDLDPGFSVAGESGGGLLRLRGRGQVGQQTDQGLPELLFGQPPAEWSRGTIASAWGKYRHTAAAVRSGSGGQVATFTADLPYAGLWQVDFHVPGFRPGDPMRMLLNAGRYELTVAGDPVTLNAGSAGAGWAPLGEFELPAGEVVIELSDESDGAAVIADAVRLRPVGRRPETGEATSEGGDADE